MPTGYTADVGDGKVTTLKDFAFRCARGMGALITMRDDSWDMPIPDRLEPEYSYYTKALAKAETELAQLLVSGPDDWDRMAEEEYNENVTHESEYRNRQIEENDRYKDMLDKVKSWNTDAEGIKEFMTQQLEISINNIYESRYVKLDGPSWALQKREKLIKDIAYHKEHIEKEVKRTEARNDWLRNLRNSLYNIDE